MKKIIYFLSTILLSSCYINSDPGTGKKIGKIVKISKDGMIFKTWEGELIRGGFTDGSGIMGGSIHFTIENSYLANQALEAFENQNEVIMDYRKEFIHSITRSEYRDAYFVEKITIVK